MLRRLLAATHRHTISHRLHRFHGAALLTCIQLTVEPGQVTLAGTGRYTLGVCTIPADNQAAADGFLLKRQDAKAILGLIGRPGPGHPAVLGYHRNELTIDTLAGSLRCSGETGSYPDWGRLLEGTPADLHPGPDGLVIGFNPEYLGRFAKVREHPSDPMKLTTRGPAKAAKVEIGERFRGLIMPVRLPR